MQFRPRIVARAVVDHADPRRPRRAEVFRKLVRDDEHHVFLPRLDGFLRVAGEVDDLDARLLLQPVDECRRVLRADDRDLDVFDLALPAGQLREHHADDAGREQR
jgi:hypothetical protein